MGPMTPDQKKFSPKNNFLSSRKKNEKSAFLGFQKIVSSTKIGQAARDMSPETKDKKTVWGPGA